MKKIHFARLFIFFIYISFFGLNGAAQDRKNSIEIKLYSNFALESSLETVGFDTVLNKPIIETNYTTNLGYFSPALSFSTPKGNAHEVELSRLLVNQVEQEIFLEESDGSVHQTIAGERKTAILIALRYEFNYNFLKNKENCRIKPSLGFGLRPSYSKSSVNSKLANVFYNRETSIATFFSIIPRVKYEVNNKWYFDLNMPFNLAQFGIITKQVENPALPVNQRTISTFNFRTTPQNYLIRFGVGFRF